MKKCELEILQAPQDPGPSGPAATSPKTLLWNMSLASFLGPLRPWSIWRRRVLCQGCQGGSAVHILLRSHIRLDRDVKGPPWFFYEYKSKQLVIFHCFTNVSTNAPWLVRSKDLRFMILTAGLLQLARTTNYVGGVSESTALSQPKD